MHTGHNKKTAPLHPNHVVIYWSTSRTTVTDHTELSLETYQNEGPGQLNINNFEQGLEIIVLLF